MLSPSWVKKARNAIHSLPTSIENPQIQKWVAEITGIVQPLWAATRIRILKLDSQNLELKIPLNHFTRKSQNQIEESLYVLGASHGLRLLLSRTGLAEVKSLKKLELECLHSEVKGAIRMRLGVSQAELEVLRAKLTSAEEVDLEILAQFYNQDDQVIAKAHMTFIARALHRLGQE